MKVRDLREPPMVAITDDERTVVHYSFHPVVPGGCGCGHDTMLPTVREEQDSWDPSWYDLPVCHVCRQATRELLRSFFPRAELPPWTKP